MDEDKEIIVDELELEIEEPKEKKNEDQKMPDYRIVQSDIDRNGNKVMRRVGAIWVNRSKAGEEYLTINIGNLRLLAFKNTVVSK